MTTKRKRSERTRYEDIAAAKLIWATPRRYHPELTAWARLVLHGPGRVNRDDEREAPRMKCSERACPWPSVRDGLCPHCWDLRYGEYPDVRKAGPLATAQADAPSLRGISYARRWDTGGKAAQRAWNGAL